MHVHYLVFQPAAAARTDKETRNFRLMTQCRNVQCCFSTLYTNPQTYLPYCYSHTTHHVYYYYLALHFNGHFPAEPGLDGFIGAKDARGGGDNWNY